MERNPASERGAERARVRPLSLPAASAASSPLPTRPPSHSTSPPPPPNRKAHATGRPLRKYTPYKFDAPPVDPLIDSFMAAAAASSDARGSGPLLLAALESIGEVGDGPSEPGGSSQRPSLSPKQHSNTSSDRTSDTSVPPSRDADSGQAAPSASAGPVTQSSAYSHPAYSNLQHPLYSRPVVPNSAYPSSNYSLPPINRSSYTPYNYQSSYSRPLSSSGSGAGPGNPLAPSGSTTLPPLNLAVLSANPDFRVPPNLSSPIGATNPSSYAQSLSLNPYNHPAYASAVSHTFQHPAYARSSISAANGPPPNFAPLPATLHQNPPQNATASSTNPYSHPALPPPGPSASFAAPLSPWSGPPPPPLSMNSGSLLAKRRRSDTAVPSAFGSHAASGRGRAAGPDQFDEEDELAESDEDERDEVEVGRTRPKGDVEGDSREPGRGEDVADRLDEPKRGGRNDGGEEDDDDDENEMAPQVKAARPTKRARTASARSDETLTKTETLIRPRPGSSDSRSPVIKAQGQVASKPKSKPEKSKEPPEKKFICPHPACGRAFARHFNLNSHIKSHQGIREFKCPECGKLFSRKHDCTRHCVAIHGYDKDSGRGVIHEPAPPTGGSNHLSPAPNSPPPLSRPLAPAAQLLHASGTATSGTSARQSLAMLLQQPSESTDPHESSTSSTSTGPT
ncbi:hypothetical protein JCM11491_006138 [Sporobolomyces phaffii]